MQIESVMSRTVFTIDKGAPFIEACHIMHSHNVGSVVVVEKEKPVGIISERDVVHNLALRGPAVIDLKVEHIMKTPLITLPPNTSLKRAAKVMRDRRIRRIPVIKNGKLVGIVTSGDILRGIQMELVYSKQETNDLKQIIYKDALTGINNYKYFKIFLVRAINNVKRFGGFLSLIMIDIDHFKQINDIYGHSAGDTVLKKIAYILRNNTGKANAVCRYGGDEFAVISSIGDLERAIERAERFRRIVEDTRFIFDKHVVNVTISLGVAVWRKGMTTALDLINAADKALYISKKNGKNRVSVSRE